MKIMKKKKKKKKRLDEKKRIKVKEMNCRELRGNIGKRSESSIMPCDKNM